MHGVHFLDMPSGPAGAVQIVDLGDMGCLIVVRILESIDYLVLLILGEVLAESEVTGAEVHLVWVADLQVGHKLLTSGPDQFDKSAPAADERIPLLTGK